jgi:RNA polymerase sigma-70 factor, ECF subfamily
MTSSKPVNSLPALSGLCSPARAAMPSSFAQAYREHAAQVARWAGRLGGVDCDVEDVVQEVFLVVSRKWTTVRDDGNFTSWLFQITRKIAANQRRHLRWRRLWAGGEALARVRWGGLGPDAELDRRRAVELFHRALDRLPEKQRTVFVLYELDGLSTQAIADLTQRNLSTVKVQLVRGRERFLAAYQRLLRRQRDDEGIQPSHVARGVVGRDVEATSRPGKKTS